MKDKSDRELAAGDYVVYVVSSGSSPDIKFGQIIDYSPNENGFLCPLVIGVDMVLVILRQLGGHKKQLDYTIQIAF